MSESTVKVFASPIQSCTARIDGSSNFIRCDVAIRSTRVDAHAFVIQLGTTTIKVSMCSNDFSITFNMEAPRRLVANRV